MASSKFVIPCSVDNANGSEAAYIKGLDRTNHQNSWAHYQLNSVVVGGASSKSKMKKSKKNKKSKMSKRMSRMFDEPIVSRVDQRQRKWEKINKDAALNPFGFTDILKTEGGLKASSRRRFSRKFRKSLSRFRLSLRKSVLGRRRNKHKNKKFSRGGAAAIVIPSFPTNSLVGSKNTGSLSSTFAIGVANATYDDKGVKMAEAQGSK